MQKFNYIEEIETAYNVLNIEHSYDDLFNTYEQIIDLKIKDNKDIKKNIQTALNRKKLCNLIFNTSLNENNDKLSLLLKNKKLVTCLSTHKYGSNDYMPIKNLTAQSYLSIHNSIDKAINDYDLIYVYSIPHNSYFVITNEAYKKAPKVSGEWQKFIETKYFIKFDTLNKYHKIMKSKGL